MTQENHNPSADAIINEGILALSAVLGGIGELLLESWGVIHTPVMIFPGICVGLLIGWLICKFRPKGEQATGAWAQFNSFVLTHMNWRTAFRRKDRKE